MKTGTTLGPALASGLLRATVADLPRLLDLSLAQLAQVGIARCVLLYELGTAAAPRLVCGWPDMTASPECLAALERQRGFLEAGALRRDAAVLLLPLIADGRLTGVLALVQGTIKPVADVESLLVSVADALANSLLRLSCEAARRALEVERSLLHVQLQDVAQQHEQAVQRLADFAATSDGWFWELDAGLRHVACPPSPCGEAMFDRETFSGKSVEEVAEQCGCDPENPEWRVVRRRLEAREPIDGFTYALRDRRGAEHFVSISGRPVFDAAGHFAGYRGVGTCINDQLQREGAARATANRFEATLNALPDLLIEADHLGRYTRIYSDAGSAAQLHHSDCLGRSFDEVLPTEISETFTTAMHVIRQFGRAEGLRYRSGDAWHEVSGARRVPEAAGELPGFVFLVRDVTSDQRQKERLRLLGKIVEMMTNLVAVVDTHQCVVWVNPAFEAHTGYCLDEIKGKPLAELTRRESTDPATVAMISRTIERGEVCRTQIMNRDKAGKAYWIDLNIHPLQGEADKLLGYVSVETVITEQKQALADLEAAQHRMARIIEGAEVGTWEWSIADDSLVIDGRWSEMLGYRPEEHQEMTMSGVKEMSHPDDCAVILAARESALDNGGLTTAEFRLRHRDGHWVWILSRGRATRWGADGRAAIIAGVHIDISERKALEQRIVAARNFFYNAMENSIAAIAVMDSDRKLVFANSEAERILGLPQSGSPMRTQESAEWCATRPDGSVLPADEDPIRMAMATGEPVRAVRNAIQLPDGTRRILSVNAVPMREDGDWQVLCSFSDITEQLETLDQISEALLRAEEASRSKSMFLANMSHEIRTPLNGVLGMAELLEGSLTEPRQKLMIRTIRNSGETLLSILNNILDMSKIEAGKFDLETMAFNPADLARQIEAVYAMKAEEKGLQFEVLIGIGGDIGRLGDPHRILQILHNLLSNAVKFTDSGRVTVRLTCRPGKPLDVEVSDTGIGMTEDQAARVFDSFDQADGSVTRRFGGTGLGMAIARQLVTLMGGDIEVISRLGHGTTVRISLPLPATDIALPVSTPPAAKIEPSFIGRHLLIADDSATNRLVLKEMLADTGATVTLVEDGHQAVKAWTEGNFDLLLLDISMPVMDGLTALKQIRDREAASASAPVPAVAVTANAMAHQVADYIVGGFDAHLAKPFRRHELLHAVSTLLHRP